MFSIHSYIGSYAKGKKKLKKDAPCNSANRRGAHQLKAQFFLKKNIGNETGTSEFGADATSYGAARAEISANRSCPC